MDYLVNHYIKVTLRFKYCCSVVFNLGR